MASLLLLLLPLINGYYLVLMIPNKHVLLLKILTNSMDNITIIINEIKRGKI
jgi:hypothetical protein